MPDQRKCTPKILDNITQLVGHTPMVHLHKISKDLPGKVIVKLEFYNPSSSVKDRPAFYMVESAEKSGRLKPGMTLVEPTSGNMGIATALMGAARGYKTIICMPETMSVERRRIQKIFGARIVLTPGALGTKGAVDMAEKLVRENPDYMLLHQFKNAANPDGHHCSTGKEIWDDTEGQVDIFVAGLGTGGTFTGVSRCLKENNPDIYCVAVEPRDHPLLSCGEPGLHNLQGLGPGFIPEILDEEIIDEVMMVTDDQAGGMARRIAHEEGILGGISAGTNVWAAVQLASRPENKGKMIVTVIPDTGERYLSTWLFENNGEMEEYMSPIENTTVEYR